MDDVVSWRFAACSLAIWLRDSAVELISLAEVRRDEALSEIFRIMSELVLHLDMFLCQVADFVAAEICLSSAIRYALGISLDILRQSPMGFTVILIMRYDYENHKSRRKYYSQLHDELLHGCIDVIDVYGGRSHHFRVHSN
jgi:hypothetical protein